MTTDADGDWLELGIARVLVKPSAAYQAALQPAKLRAMRADKIAATRAEGLRRMKLASAAIESADDVRMLALLWPALNAPGTNPTLAKLRDIYLYAKTKTAALAAADLATVEAYDPAADAGWPV